MDRQFQVRSMQGYCANTQMTSEQSHEQKSFHDAHAKAHEFKTGDKVWLYWPNSVEKGVTSKLAYKWVGPYVTEKVHGPVTFSLVKANGTVHAGQVVNTRMTNEGVKERKWGEM